MKKILSCDWGTSSFRLKLVDTESARVLFSENSLQGISETHHAWRHAGAKAEERVAFYQKTIDGHIINMERHLGESLELVPLVVSGMASSSIGMIELPYKKIPFALDGSAMETFYLPSTNAFPRDTLIVSGAAAEDDVMRGEETMLIGCAQQGFFDDDAKVIFPGTHSKHVVIKSGRVVAWKTYMTGEFFDLLSRQSILSVAVNKAAWSDNREQREAFRQGVRTGSRTNLLHSAFSVRTNSLFHRTSPEQNYHYLSGLLIGGELRDIVNDSASPLVLVSDLLLGSLYEEAMDTLEIKSSLKSFRKTDAGDALTKGQLAIYRSLVK